MISAGSIPRDWSAGLHQCVATVRALAAAWVGAWTVAAPHKTAQVSTRHSARGPCQENPAAPGRLDLADQWGKLAGVLTTAIEGAGSVRDMQVAATQQLDLAQYGITTLVDELAAVMSLPGRHPRLATIHALTAHAGPKPATRRALAA